MGSQRFCDICHFYRPDVKRYGLSIQVRSERRPNGRLYHRQHNMGGIDLCDECWTRVGKPKQRPELRGKTGPKREEGAA